MASEICQTKSETVLKTAGKLCNSGEIGHMHILYCKVAQQTKFVISEAEGSPPPPGLLLAGRGRSPAEAMSSGASVSPRQRRGRLGSGDSTETAARDEVCCRRAKSST